MHVLRSLIRSIGASAVRASAPDMAPATASLHCGAALRFFGFFFVSVSDASAMAGLTQDKGRVRFNWKEYLLHRCVSLILPICRKARLSFFSVQVSLVSHLKDNLHK